MAKQIDQNKYMNGFTSYGTFESEAEALSWARKKLIDKTYCVMSMSLRKNTWWIIAKEVPNDGASNG
jgi:hypothetical protein